MKRVRHLFRTYPFTLFGLFSHALLALALLIGRSDWQQIPPWLDAVGWTLMVPAYLLHLLVVAIWVQLFGVTSPPDSYWILSFPVRFLPFLLADYLLARVHRHRGQ